MIDEMYRRLFVGILGRAVPMTASVIIAVLAPANSTKFIFYAIATAVICGSEYWGTVRPLNMIADLRRKMMDNHLEQFVRSASVDGVRAKIRANVMLIQRHWFRPYFYQFYQYGMEGHPDANLRFAIWKGVAGKALRSQKQTIVFETDPTNRDWGFSSEEQSQISDVKAVASIPIFREIITLRGHKRFQFFGVVNFDALDQPGVELLGHPAIQSQLLAHAVFVQLILR